MKLTRMDFPLIWRGIFLFLLSAILGSAAVVISHVCIAKAQSDRSQAVQDLQSAHNHLSIAEASLRDRNIYATRYTELQRRGFMDGVGRKTLELSLNELHKSPLLSRLYYVLAPQQTDTQRSALVADTFEVSRYPLSLRFDLLHAGRLLDVFEKLQSVRGGWFVTDHCTLSRIQPSVDSSALHAECSGASLSLQPRIRS